MSGEMYLSWLLKSIYLDLILKFLGVDWPDWFDPGEGGRGDCWELSTNSALHPGITFPLSPFQKKSLHFCHFQIKIMKALEDDADYKLKTLKENDLDNKDIEEIKVRFLIKVQWTLHLVKLKSVAEMNSLFSWGWRTSTVVMSLFTSLRMAPRGWSNISRQD